MKPSRFSSSSGLGCLLAAFLAWLCLISGAHAHAVTNSQLALQVDDEQPVAGSWRIRLLDLEPVVALDQDHDGRIVESEVLPRLPALSTYLASRLELWTPARGCTIEPGKSVIDTSHLVFKFSAHCPKNVESLSLRYDLFFDHDLNHQGHLVLTQGEDVHTSVFTAGERSTTITLGAVQWWEPLREYPVEGIWHIWIGYDHILFLLVLLLPAVLPARTQGGASSRRRSDLRGVFVNVAKIVTAFTVAHSITLSLAATELVTLPTDVVESVIALSVVVAALNNLYPLVTGHTWVVAFVFGLIHGFGFANVLVELGLPSQQLALALFGFNVGVEIGQLAIVSVFLPAAFLLRKTMAYRIVGVRIGSAAIAVVSVFWFLERAYGIEIGAEGIASLAVTVAGIAMLTWLSGPLEHGAKTPWIAGGRALGAGLLVVGVLWPSFEPDDYDTRPAAESLAARWTIQEGGQGEHSGQRAHALFAAGGVVEDSLLPELERALVALATHSGGDSVQSVVETGDTGPAEAVFATLADEAKVSGDHEAFVAAVRHQAILKSLGDPAGAEVLYQSALAVRPDDPEVRHQLALLWARDGRLDLAQPMLEDLVDSAREVQDRARVGELRTHLALLHEAKGDDEGAIAAYRDAATWYLDAEDPAAAARVHSRLAEFCMRRLHWGDAWGEFNRARALYEELGERTALAKTLARMGDLHVAGAQLGDAKTQYEAALAALGGKGDPRLRAEQYRNLAVVAQLSNDQSHAARMLRQSLQIHEALGEDVAIARDCMKLGLIYKKTRQYDEAEVMFARAIEIDTALGRKEAAAHHYSRLGNVHQLQGELTEAETMYRKAIDLHTVAGHQADIAKDYANLGNVYRMRGEFDQARDLYGRSLALFEREEQTGDARRVQKLLDHVAGANRPLSPG